MAKMLDAMERARQEREQQRQQGAAAEPLNEVLDASAPKPALPHVFPQPGFASTPHGAISELVVGAHDEQSPVTEQARQIHANLETVLAGYRSRAIVISSPAPGDGKTLLAANLAAVLAEDPRQKVLLVDADLRAGGQHQLFGLRPTPGLSDYLQERVALEEVIQPTSIANLHVLAAGHELEKPAVMLAGERLRALVADLQRDYHWILFDTPALLPYTDASVLTRECTGLLLVVRLGQTSRAMVEQAQELLAELRLPVLGCVLNGTEPPAGKRALKNGRARHAAGGPGFVS